MDIVYDYLNNFGPSLTSRVSDYLVQSIGLTPAAARKRVSRSTDGVKRLAYITFPRKARFIYLEQQFGSPVYWDNLVAALQATNSAYGHAISALRLRGGLVPARQFAIACGAPIKQSRHLSPETIVSRLCDAGLTQRINVPGLGDCVSLVQHEDYYSDRAITVQARLTAEDILLGAVRDWTRKLGLVSYERIKTRDGADLPMVGTFAWDITAPSYVANMAQIRKDGKVRPGFFACDVFFGGQVDVSDIRPFIAKCTKLRGLRNIGPCLHMFVAEHYTKDAFLLLKQHGIIPATPRTLFGDEIAEGLSEVTSVLINAAHAVVNPEKLDNLFRRISKIEGAANQLRGTLLEFLVASFWRREGESVTINRIFKNGLEQAEVDVLVHREGKSVTFIECKGYSPYATVPDELVKQWLEKRIPFLFKEAHQHPDWRNHKYRFEFWSSGALSQDALAMITAARERIKRSRYDIDILLGPEILSVFKAGKDSAFATAFEKHFIRPYEPTIIFDWD